MARPIINENQAWPPADNGATMLFVGELHWWTTEAELENVLSQYGRVKEIDFFVERASGKSKGCCQVDFYESGSAAACKDGMNGYVFNGRPCVVTPCSNFKVKDYSTQMLETKIKMLETKIMMLESSLGLEMSPVEYACESGSVRHELAMLHKLLHDMENLSI